jgi:DNA primase
MSALWPVLHRCGHRVEWDLSRKRPDDRAGFARWLALRDCTPCWWAKRRKYRLARPTFSPRTPRDALDGWEHAARMPALTGSDKAIAWARKIRHRLLSAALPPSARLKGTTDEAVLALVGHARTIASAAWWIDHRKDRTARPRGRLGRSRRHAQERRPNPAMSTIDCNAIKARHRLAEVARCSGFDVAHAGRVMICCPTPGHDDRTPSLQLDLDRDRYHCFGCAAHGDVIDWVRDVEGVDAPGAVAILESGRAINAAISAGTSRRSWTRRHTEPPNLDRTALERIIAANEAAWDYYSYTALHERGATYLAGRGIDIAALETETHGPVVGHTPSAKTRIDGLVAHLTSRGFTETELLDAGLATRLADGCVIDFHRDCIVVPVRDGDGSVVGLLGRDITGSSPVKYLNPATTAAYQKRRSLYRPSEPVLLPDASIVVCEGPLDALAIASQAAASGVFAGFAPVAACGRTIFDSQLYQILAIHSRAPVLAGDGDAPGRQASIEWARRMLAKGRESVITEWPDGYTPLPGSKAGAPKAYRRSLDRDALTTKAAASGPATAGLCSPKPTSRTTTATTSPGELGCPTPWPTRPPDCLKLPVGATSPQPRPSSASPSTA